MYSKKIVRCGIASAALLINGFAFAANAKAATSVPAVATFGSSSNSPTADCAYADAYGSYANGSYLDSTGATVTGVSNVSTSQYFLRTVSSGGTSATNVRGVYLDFKNVVVAPAQTTIADPNDASGAQLHLGGGTTVNFIPDLRIIAANLFAANATTKGTSVIMPFSLQPEFTGSSDFELDFDGNLTVTAPDVNTRVITASGANAAATLYLIQNGRKSAVGRFSIPFSLAVRKA